MLRPGWAAGSLLGLRFCRVLELFSPPGGATRQPQCTEPCQCVCDQLGICHGALQGHMQPLKCAAGIVEPAPLGATAGLLGRWFVGCGILLLSIIVF